MFHRNNNQKNIHSYPLAYVKGPEAWYLLLILKENLKIEMLTQNTVQVHQGNCY